VLIIIILGRLIIQVIKFRNEIKWIMTEFVIATVSRSNMLKIDKLEAAFKLLDKVSHLINCYPTQWTVYSSCNKNLGHKG